MKGVVLDVRQQQQGRGQTQGGSLCGFTLGLTLKPQSPCSPCCPTLCTAPKQRSCRAWGSRRGHGGAGAAATCPPPLAWKLAPPTTHLMLRALYSGICSTRLPSGEGGRPGGSGASGLVGCGPGCGHPGSGWRPLEGQRDSQAPSHRLLLGLQEAMQARRAGRGHGRGWRRSSSAATPAGATQHTSVAAASIRAAGWQVATDTPGTPCRPTLIPASAAAPTLVQRRDEGLSVVKRHPHRFELLQRHQAQQPLPAGKHRGLCQRAGRRAVRLLAHRLLLRAWWRRRAVVCLAAAHNACRGSMALFIIAGWPSLKHSSRARIAQCMLACWGQAGLTHLHSGRRGLPAAPPLRPLPSRGSCGAAG